VFGCVVREADLLITGRTKPPRYPPSNLAVLDGQRNSTYVGQAGASRCRHEGRVRPGQKFQDQFESQRRKDVSNPRLRYLVPPSGKHECVLTARTIGAKIAADVKLELAERIPARRAVRKRPLRACAVEDGNRARFARYGAARLKTPDGSAFPRSADPAAYYRLR
jgi:hypothetical protein